jgi:hypothetical protein
MSIGNLKDSGNQGNNMPWQWNVLKGLQCICDEVKAINIDTDDLEQLLADLIAELEAGIDVTVVNGAGAAAVNIQDGGNSITVDGTVSLSSGTLTALENTTVTITAAQFTKTVTPNLIVTAGTTGVISDVVYSISFASNGTGPATISVDGGLTPQLIPAGTTINLDAGGLNWSYAANKFAWDTTAVGASLIITYNS